MTTVHSPLADALRDRYVLERELGHGGMMWRNADPELRPYVNEAREGLVRLTEERR